MKLLRTIFFMMIVIFHSKNIFCQSANLDNVTASINNYQIQNLNEKTFVHTDKSFYVAGEIIWFKIYNVDASSYQLLDISKVAYVEIISKDQKPVLQAKISLKGGLGDGSFYLPFSINSGNYILRTYTSWDEKFFT